MNFLLLMEFLWLHKVSSFCTEGADTNSGMEKLLRQGPGKCCPPSLGTKVWEENRLQSHRQKVFPPSEEVKAPKTLCSPRVPAICTSPIHEKRGITRLHRRCHPWKCLLTSDGPMSSITEAWAAFWPSQSQPVSKQPQLIRKAMRASVLESYTELFVVSCTLWRPHLLSKKSRLS